MLLPNCVGYCHDSLLPAFLRFGPRGIYIRRRGPAVLVPAVVKWIPRFFSNSVDFSFAEFLLWGGIQRTNPIKNMRDDICPNSN